MSEYIKLSIDGAVARLLIDNPEKANSLSPDDLLAIREAINLVNENKSVRVFLLEAKGKYFCSGFNIGKMQPEQGGSGFEETVNMLEACAPVTIACLEGGVYGGGTDLALACDFRLGLDSINMFMPAARLGIHLYGSALRRYVTRMGVNNAKALVLTARKISAKKMHEMGYLTDIFNTSADLHDFRDELLRDVTQLAPLSLRFMKKNMNSITNGVFDADVMAKDALLVGISKDSTEGRMAWKEKRQAVFVGE